MGSVMWRLLETDPSPSPSPIDPNAVTPGPLAFIVTFALAGAIVLLVLSMNRHLRRVKFDEAREQAERTAREAAEGSESSGRVSDDGAPPDTLDDPDPDVTEGPDSESGR